MTKAEQLLELIEGQKLMVGDQVKVNAKALGSDVPGKHQANILRRMNKEGGGSVEIMAIHGDQAEVAGHKASAILGTLWVPLSACTKVKP